MAGASESERAPARRGTAEAPQRPSSGGRRRGQPRTSSILCKDAPPFFFVISTLAARQKCSVPTKHGLSAAAPFFGLGSFPPSPSSTGSTARLGRSDSDTPCLVTRFDRKTKQSNLSRSAIEATSRKERMSRCSWVTIGGKKNQRGRSEGWRLEFRIRVCRGVELVGASGHLTSRAASNPVQTPLSLSLSLTLSLQFTAIRCNSLRFTPTLAPSSPWPARSSPSPPSPLHPHPPCNVDCTLFPSPPLHLLSLASASR